MYMLPLQELNCHRVDEEREDVRDGSSPSSWHPAASFDELTTALHRSRWYLVTAGATHPTVIVRFTGNTAKVATAKTSNADDIHMLFSNVARPKKITNVNNCNLHRGMSTPSPTQLHKTNSFLLFRPLTHQCADKPDGKSALDVQIQPTVFPDLGHAYIKKGRASEVIGGNSKCYSTTHWQ